jgi:hypothetical protein
VFFMAYQDSSQLLDQKMAMNGNAGKTAKMRAPTPAAQRYGMP